MSVTSDRACDGVASAGAQLPRGGRGDIEAGDRAEAGPTRTESAVGAAPPRQPRCGTLHGRPARDGRGERPSSKTGSAYVEQGGRSGGPTRQHSGEAADGRATRTAADPPRRRCTLT